ncbi:peptidylprolyl isomerase [Paenibacillus sp. GCM10028914]|uniref:peptidylprolyl isomerase n=1 Tax=Paenibacillus sp. GCM10028914 TaxID=3273416 RepID=UPI0036089578
MKENDVQPTNGGRPEDDFGQASDQNPNVTPDPITPEDNNEIVSEIPDSDKNSDITQDDLKPLDDTTVQSSESVGVVSSDNGDIKQSPASTGGNGGKGWMITSLVLAAALIVVLIVNPFGKNNGGKAVAKVNNKEITQNELYEELVSAGGTQTLDYLITQELIKQELDKKSIVISDEEINKEIESIKSSFASEDEFNTAMQSSGLTLDTLKEQTKFQLELTKLMGDKVEVTDEEIKTTYEQYKDSFATAEQVRASHILVETKEEAEAIIKQLNEGADFATIAKEKNEDATKDTGGDLGFFERGQMDSAFEEAAFKLEKGKFSQEPVKSSYGYHVIMVTDHKEATNPTLEDKKEEIKKQLVSNKVSEQYASYVQELKDNAKITNTLEEKTAADEETKTETSDN